VSELNLTLWSTKFEPCEKTPLFFPQTISVTRTPKAYISAFSVSCPLLRHSGAIYPLSYAVYFSLGPNQLCFTFTSIYLFEIH